MFRKLFILWNPLTIYILKSQNFSSWHGRLSIGFTAKYKVTLRFKALYNDRISFGGLIFYYSIPRTHSVSSFLYGLTAERNSAWDTFFAFFTWNLMIFSSSIFCFVIFPALRPIAVWPVFNFPANFSMLFLCPCSEFYRISNLITEYVLLISKVFRTQQLLELQLVNPIY